MSDGPQDAPDKSPAPSTSPRCRACQLQLCKSRSERPHAALTESKGDSMMRGTEQQFLCKTCGATLINSSDLAKPGWRHQR